MAKRKASGEPPASKFVRLELSTDDHARLRIMAAEAGVSMAAFVRREIERTIAEASKPGRKRDKA